MASIGGPTGQQQTLYYGNQESQDYAGAAQASEKPDFPLPQPSAPPTTDQPPPYSASLPNPGPLAAPTVVLPSQFFHDGIQDVFFTACEKGDLALISQMIARGADVNAKKIYPPFKEGDRTYREIKSPLMVVSELGNLDAAKMLANAGALMEVKGSIKIGGVIGRLREYYMLVEEATVLHAACFVPSEKFNPALVSFLVSAGADVNAKAKPTVSEYVAFYTPLYMLCNRKNNDATIDLLIQNGAKPEGDFSYITNAIQTGHSKQCIESLLRAGASTTYKSPIGAAAKEGLIEIVELLLKHGAEMNPTQNSPLEAAAVNNQLPMMDWLLKKGANPSISFAIERHDFPEIWERINATKSIMYNLRMTLLMCAVAKGNVEMVALLLQAKADTRTKGTYKKFITPVFSAPGSSYEKSFTLSLLQVVSLLTPPDKKEAITKLLRQHGVSEECAIS